MIDRKSILPAIWLALIMDVSASWIFWIFWINILVYIYKGVALPYVGSDFGVELTFFIVWGLTTLFRYQIGQHALSRCEPTGLIFFIVVTAFATICCNLYFINYQSYILRVEVILNAFCMALELVELVLGLACALIYMKRQAI